MKDVPKFMQEIIFIENAGLQLKIVNFLLIASTVLIHMHSFIEIFHDHFI